MSEEEKSTEAYVEHSSSRRKSIKDPSNFTVLVTGATGFVAGHVIQQLLLRGYKVRGTVRDLGKPERFAFLSRIANAASNLSLVELDLLLPNDHPKWAAAFEGVDFVMHVAAPTDLRLPEGFDKVIVDPIITGTRTVMQYSNATPSVKRVVLTSCMCAICDEFVPGKLYTEVDWNEKATMERNPYAYAKTTAENEAWAFVNNTKCHFDLVTILPGLVLGPHLNNGVTQSHRFILALLDGTMPRVPNLTYAIADVRDVASSHVVALEKQEANGRYYCGTVPLPLVRILQIIHENFADLHVPSRQAPDGIISLASGRINRT
jgi:dihydroflavonol-4-reductase